MLANPFQKHSILFAPLEGITDGIYRNSIMQLYPEWDYFYTDFLRIPTVGHFNRHHFIEHIGEEIYRSPELMKKTGFQILTTEKAQTLQHLDLIKELGIKHLDLNLGCPSKTVNSHGGGAYLLKDLQSLKKIITNIRNNYDGFFSCKMRIGFHDDNNFVDTLKLLEGCGVQMITIHARTRDQLYKGVADWQYFKEAADILKIPVIANGDIWTIDDIKKVFNETNCHSIMLGRSAMKTPWMPKLFRDHQNSDLETINKIRRQEIKYYFKGLQNSYEAVLPNEENILKRFKSISRYLFDDLEDAEKIKSSFLRTDNLNDFKNKLLEL